MPDHAMPTDYKVKDFSLAGWGRKEISMAEDEMPGLMAIRAEYGAEPAAEGRPHRRLPAHDHPDRRADRDADRAGRHGPLVVLQHLLDPGPCRRRRRRRRHPVFAWKGMNEEEFWWCIEQTVRGPDGWTPEHDPG